MPEFRTRDLTTDKEESKGGLEKHLDRVFENIKNDPEIQGHLVKELQESDVNPVFLRAIMGGEMDMENFEAKPANSEGNEQAHVQTKTVTKKPTPEELIGFIEEVEEYTGEDFTLGELKEWAEENKGIVKTAIDLKF